MLRRNSALRIALLDSARAHPIKDICPSEPLRGPFATRQETENYPGAWSFGETHVRPSAGRARAVRRSPGK
jgi:hypothetical protein